MYKKTFLSTLFAFFTICGNSQTVVWQMPPTDYNQIERISSTLFKVVRNGKIGLINADGTMTISVTATSIKHLLQLTMDTENESPGVSLTMGYTTAIQLSIIH